MSLHVNTPFIQRPKYMKWNDDHKNIFIDSPMKVFSCLRRVIRYIVKLNGENNFHWQNFLRQQKMHKSLHNFPMNLLLARVEIAHQHAIRFLCKYRQKNARKCEEKVLQCRSFRASGYKRNTLPREIIIILNPLFGHFSSSRNFNSLDSEKLRIHFNHLKCFLGVSFNNSNLDSQFASINFHLLCWSLESDITIILLFFY